MAKKLAKTEIVKKVVEELLTKLQIEASIDVVGQEENLYQVNLETQEAGLLIGYHGETLASLQLLSGIVAHKELGEWARIVIEIGDYRAKRNESLSVMAQEYADRVIQSGQPLALAPMPSIERRAVHMALAERTDVEAVSEGEGKMRHIVIHPKE